MDYLHKCSYNQKIYTTRILRKKKRIGGETVTLESAKLDIGGSSPSRYSINNNLMKTTLYKLDNKNKIREWSIVVEDDSYYTITGIKDGKLITHKPIYAKAKNVGKSNETTPSEQALKEVSSIITKQKTKGYYEDIAEAAQGPKHFQVQLAHPYHKHSKKVVFDDESLVFTQPKLDGIRSTMQWEESSNKATSRDGKDQPVVQHILDEWGSILRDNNMVADGELYNHDLRHDFNKITSLVKKQRPTSTSISSNWEWENNLESARMIEYHVYDVFFNDEPDLVFSERFAKLVDLISKDEFTYIKQVPTYSVSSEKEMMENYDHFLQDEYEGMIIRLDTSYEHKKTSNMLKHKEFCDSEFEILELIQGTGNRHGMAGAALIKVPGVEEPKKTNIKGSRAWLQQLWDERYDINGKGLMGTVRYPNLTPAGVPRFPYLVAIRDYE